MVDNFESNPFFYYLLGLLWADGAMERGSYRVILYGLESDLKHIESKILETGNWHKRLLHREGRKPQLIFSMYDKRIREYLSKYNYFTKNGHTKILDDLNIEQQKLWLQGFLDGDGNIVKGKYIRVSFSGPYDQDWSFLNKILQRLNIEPYYYKEESKLGHKSSNVIIKSIIDSLKFLDYIYDTPYDFGYIRKKKQYYDYLKDYRSVIEKQLMRNIVHMDEVFVVRIKTNRKIFSTLQEARQYRHDSRLNLYGKVRNLDSLSLDESFLRRLNF